MWNEIITAAVSVPAGWGLGWAMRGLVERVPDLPLPEAPPPPQPRGTGHWVDVCDAHGARLGSVRIARLNARIRLGAFAFDHIDTDATTGAWRYRPVERMSPKELSQVAASLAQ